MSLKKKYLYSIFTYSVIYIFGFVFIALGTSCARYLYAYMNYLFPRVFPLFSAVSEKEEYAKYLMLIASVGIFTAIWIINFFALRLDNSKFELMIKRTDGLYTVKDGIKIYLGEFGISEVISGVLLPLILVIPPFFIPEFGVQSVPVVGFLIMLMEKLLWLGYAFKEYFSIGEALLLVAVFSSLSRAALIPGALKHWRASWLSGAIT